jgi:hypothetical protein
MQGAGPVGIDFHSNLSRQRKSSIGVKPRWMNFDNLTEIGAIGLSRLCVK